MSNDAKRRDVLRSGLTEAMRNYVREQPTLVTYDLETFSARVLELCEPVLDRLERELDTL